MKEGHPKIIGSLSKREKPPHNQQAVIDALPTKPTIIKTEKTFTEEEVIALMLGELPQSPESNITEEHIEYLLQQINEGKQEAMLVLKEMSETTVPPETIDDAYDHFFSWLQQRNMRLSQRLQTTKDRDVLFAREASAQAAASETYLVWLKEQARHIPELAFDALETEIITIESLLLLIYTDLADINLSTEAKAEVIATWVDYLIQRNDWDGIHLKNIQKLLPQDQAVHDMADIIVSGIMAELSSYRLIQETLQQSVVETQQELVIRKTTPDQDVYGGVDLALTLPDGKLVAYIDIKGHRETGVVVLTPNGENVHMHRGGEEGPTVQSKFNIPDSTIRTTRAESIPTLCVRLTKEVVNRLSQTELAQFIAELLASLREIMPVHGQTVEPSIA